MEYRTLGSTGLQVSAISLGSWATFGECLDDADTRSVIQSAYEAGINLFDGAETYGQGAAEEAMGRALKVLGWPRETFILTSKAYWGVHKKVPNSWGLSRKHLFDACHAALRRLQVDYLDLYFCHRFDERVPLEETVRAMTDLVGAGKILHWGTSEWASDQVLAAHRIASESRMVAPQVEQLQYSLLYKRNFQNVAPLLRDSLKCGLTTWSPLASGILSGRYVNGIGEGDRLGLQRYKWLRDSLFQQGENDILDRARAMAALSNEAGIPQAQLALAWVLRNPMVDTAITGASRPCQIEESVRAVAAVSAIDPQVFEAVESLWAAVAH